MVSCLEHYYGKSISGVSQQPAAILEGYLKDNRTSECNSPARGATHPPTAILGYELSPSREIKRAQ